MKLAAPWFLLLLLLVLPVVALAYYEHHQRGVRAARLASAALFSRMASGAGPGVFLARRLLSIGALVLVILALASPRWGIETEIRPRRGLDIVFAIDISRSMRARDVLPDRLERAKAEIGLALDDLGENRVGIIAFAGTAYVQCPLTTDVEATRSFLRALDPELVPYPGTAIGAALEVARNLFMAEAEADEAVARAGRILVIVSDGEDHEGGLKEPMAQLKALGVRTLVLGVGDTLGEPIPISETTGRTLGYKKERGGETVMTRMNPELLLSVAEGLGGRFIDAKRETDLGMSELKDLVNGLEKREFEARVERHDIDRARWPLVLALALLLLAAALPGRREERS